ncbi:LRR receptor-like serine threonine-protein kinase [Seminavis robusta]|uniref:LRR receptor-like serine threonine-protein kinase n=1 Tax=Seminavis robusta TaxID=568900 RepID=A0A9N8H4A1_9STRA|nr:LRR receptor-like serine threonine-protein kinase [Seminavis robusta]|eukprot:Sro57_g033270.1 LRR receptor-like serine threonine-protein kinase (2465) ;mRNA; f:52890-60873
MDSRKKPPPTANNGRSTNEANQSASLRDGGMLEHEVPTAAVARAPQQQNELDKSDDSNNQLAASKPRRGFFRGGGNRNSNNTKKKPEGKSSSRRRNSLSPFRTTSGGGNRSPNQRRVMRRPGRSATVDELPRQRSPLTAQVERVVPPASAAHASNVPSAAAAPAAAAQPRMQRRESEDDIFLEKLLAMRSRQGDDQAAARPSQQNTDADDLGLNPLDLAIPLERQKTPNLPGAWSRQGNAIRRRGRASLTSSTSSTHNSVREFREENDDADEEEKLPFGSSSAAIANDTGEDDIFLEKMLAMRHGSEAVRNNSQSSSRSATESNNKPASRPNNSAAIANDTGEDDIFLEKMLAMRHGSEAVRNNSESSSRSATESSKPASRPGAFSAKSNNNVVKRPRYSLTVGGRGRTSKSPMRTTSATSSSTPKKRTASKSPRRTTSMPEKSHQQQPRTPPSTRTNAARRASISSSHHSERATNGTMTQPKKVTASKSPTRRTTSLTERSHQQPPTPPSTRTTAARRASISSSHPSEMGTNSTNNASKKRTASKSPRRTTSLTDRPRQQPRAPPSTRPNQPPSTRQSNQAGGERRTSTTSSSHHSVGSQRRSSISSSIHSVGTRRTSMSGSSHHQRLQALEEGTTSADDDALMMEKIIATRHGSGFLRGRQQATQPRQRSEYDLSTSFHCEPNNTNVNHHADGSESSNNSNSNPDNDMDASALTRQVTPNQPGAFHREGNKIVQRRRATLTRTSMDQSQQSANMDTSQRSQTTTLSGSSAGGIKQPPPMAGQFPSKPHRTPGRRARSNESQLSRLSEDGMLPAQEDEDPFLVEKLVASRHGDSFVRTGNQGDVPSSAANDASKGGTVDSSAGSAQSRPGAFHSKGSKLAQRGKGTLTSSNTSATPSMDQSRNSLDDDSSQQGVATLSSTQQQPPASGKLPSKPQATSASRSRSNESQLSTLAEDEQDDAGEDPFLVEKLLAARYGPSMLRNQGACDTSNDNGANSEDQQDQSDEQAQRFSQTDSTHAGRTGGDAAFQRTGTDDSIDVEKLAVMRHGPSIVRQGQRENSTRETSESGEEIHSSTEIETSLQDFTTENSNNANNASLRRQMTPEGPGAYHRDGSRIVPRGKGILTQDPSLRSLGSVSQRRESVKSLNSSSHHNSMSSSNHRYSRHDRFNRRRSNEREDHIPEEIGCSEELMETDSGEAPGMNENRDTTTTERRPDELKDEKAKEGKSRSFSAQSVDLEEILVQRHGSSILSRDESEQDDFESKRRRSKFRAFEGEAKTLTPATSMCGEKQQAKRGSGVRTVRSIPSNSSLGKQTSTKSDLDDMDDSFSRQVSGFSSRQASGFSSGRFSREFALSDMDEESSDMSSDIEEGYSGFLSIASGQGDIPAYEAASRPYHDLVEARIVTGESEQALANATPMDLSERPKRDDSPLYRWGAFGCAAVVVIVIIVLLVSTLGGGDPETVTQSPAPSSSAPSQSPTASPTANIIYDLPPKTREAVALDSDGPQGRAYQWLLADPNLSTYSQDRLLQRFALSTLYYSTKRGRWTREGGWLSYDVHECQWDFRADGENLLPCGPDPNSEKYENLLLYGNGLQGSIPEEVFLLTSLRKIDLQGNSLLGTFPVPSWYTTYPNLWPNQLDLIALVSNELSGALPSELGYFKSLQGLYLGSNRFTGSLPSELANVAGLVDLSAEDNLLTGTLPTEFAALNRLVLINLGGNEKLTGGLSNLFVPSTNASFLDADVELRVGAEILFPNLKALDLVHNSFSGGLPSEIGRACPSLERLALANNRYSGGLPSEIGLMSSLTYVDLRNNGLTITQLPSELGLLTAMSEFRVDGDDAALAGTLPTELGQLSQLGELMLDASGFATNRGMLTGSIPSELGNLRNATNLFLSRHRLLGTMPSEMGQMTKLEKIWLFQNGVMGTATYGLYGPIPSELGQLTALTSLLLFENSLTATIPPEVKQLSNLEGLHLHTNRLQGPVPDMQMPRMKELMLHRNFLTGTIAPSMIGSMTNLEYMSLYSCRFSGPIPSELGLMTALTFLRADSNYFSALPSEIGNNRNLATIVLAGNALQGSIPSEIAQVGKALLHLYIGSNALTGSLPTELGELDQLAGHVPSEFGLLSNLQGFSVQQNIMTGSVPSSLGLLTSLTSLSLAENAATGSMPSELGSLSVLGKLVLNNNQMSGSLPSELGLLTSLSELALEHNLFNNTLPTELGGLNQLAVLKVAENSLSGPLVSEVGLLTSLADFSAEYNLLSGTVPTELGKLTSVQKLKFQSNRLTGTIVSEVGLLTSVADLSFSSNQMNGTLPTELASLSQLQFLWLAENSFSGSIPGQELSLLRQKLNVLSLRDNSLEGRVPSELGLLGNLWSLELDNNPLTGELPSELSSLSSLFDGLSGFLGTDLTGTLPDSLCGKVVFSCTGLLCGCGCPCIVPTEPPTPAPSNGTIITIFSNEAVVPEREKFLIDPEP